MIRIGRDGVGMPAQKSMLMPAMIVQEQLQHKLNRMEGRHVPWQQFASRQSSSPKEWFSRRLQSIVVK